MFYLLCLRISSVEKGRMFSIEKSKLFEHTKSYWWAFLLKMKNIKVKKAIEIKSKNKRFTVVWYENESIAFHTKTLQDFKNRIITETSGIYSYESFLILFDGLSYIANDPEFQKQANRVKGQIQKNISIAKIYG